MVVIGIDETHFSSIYNVFEHKIFVLEHIFLYIASNMEFQGVGFII